MAESESIPQVFRKSRFTYLLKGSVAFVVIFATIAT